MLLLKEAGDNVELMEEAVCSKSFQIKKYPSGEENGKWKSWKKKKNFGEASFI